MRALWLCWIGAALSEKVSLLSALDRVDAWMSEYSTSPLASAVQYITAREYSTSPLARSKSLEDKPSVCRLCERRITSAALYVSE